MDISDLFETPTRRLTGLHPYPMHQKRKIVHNYDVEKAVLTYLEKTQEGGEIHPPPTKIVIGLKKQSVKLKG